MTTTPNILDQFRLDGKIALITGAASGLGAAIAEALAQAGATVAVHGNRRPADETAHSIGGNAAAFQADLSSTEGPAQLFTAVQQHFGRVDILINNAAVFAKLGAKDFMEISSEEFDQVMAINVRGPFECAKAVAPIMAGKGGGKIVNIASSTVFKGVPHLLHYVSSKGAVVAMTR